MNCIKCPIVEECVASKMTNLVEYSAGLTIPVKAEPYSKDNCPLIKVIEESKNISPE